MKLKMWAAVMALVLGTFLYTSCEKTPVADVNDAEIGEMAFKFDIPGDSFGKKGTSPQDGKTPECRDETADYVTIQLEDEDGALMWYTLDLLSLGDGTITEALKLPAGHYIVKEFYVFSDENGDMDGWYPAETPQGDYPAPDGMEYDDDVVLYASPYEGSYYDDLFSFTFNVDQPFELLPFEKAENYIDVLCYRPADYKDFGFKHWDYHAFEVREKCFYGDICTKFYDDFANYQSDNNPYFGWPEHYDVHGIFKVVVQNPDRVDENGDVVPGAVTSASNYDWVTPSDSIKPICVEYLDDLEVDGETYNFEIFVYWPDGSVTSEVTGTFTDENPNPFGGEDGVFTWQIGDCTHPSADIEVILPAWIGLPDQANASIQWKLPNPVHPNYSAFDVTINSVTGGVPALYPEEFENLPNTIGGYCGDLNHTIASSTFDFDLYSSLDVPAMPIMYQGYNWNALNWLINQDEAILASAAEGEELQAIIWMIIHGTDATTLGKIDGYLDLNSTEVLALVPLANDIVNNHSGFTPRTGDWSIVLFDPIEPVVTDGENKRIFQLVIVRVDP